MSMLAIQSSVKRIMLTARAPAASLCIQVASKLLLLDDRGLRCTREGLRVVDAMLPDLVLALERYYQPAAAHMA